MTNEKEIVNNFVRETNENNVLKKHGFKITKENKGHYYELFKFALIGLGIFCGVFLYLVYNGYLTEDIEIPDFVCNISCPDVPNCVCPENNCSNACNFPDKISVEITNQTN